MSWETSTYVLGIKVGDATRKLVLMGYANHAHSDGTAAFCSVKTAADYAECSKRTAQRHIAYLVEHGYMREGDQQLVSHYPANKRPVVYDIAMSERQRLEWEVLHAAGANARREAATATGKLGGAASAQVRRGANLSRPESTSTPDAGRDVLSPPNGGDNSDTSGVTELPAGGDMGVTQTTLETTPGTTQISASDSLRSPADAARTLSEQEEETGRDDSGHPLKGKKLDLLTDRVAKSWWEWIDREGRSRPTNSFPACKGVIRAALGNGHHPKAVKSGLVILTTEGRPCSANTLGIAMQVAAGQAPGGRGPAYTDQGTWGDRPGEPGVPMTDEEASRFFGIDGGHGDHAPGDEREVG